MSTQTPENPDYIEYIESHKDEYEKDLFELLSIPSISSQKEHDYDVAKTAQWICDRLASMNLDAQIVETTGHPAVFAQTKNPNPDLPTILFYGHYDVQPVDPLNLWKTPPFEPVIKDGFVYARGASDDKGQMFTHILGPEAWYKTTGSMPVNVKYILEGDEESGGDAMDKFVRSNADLLACDCVVISDSQMFAPGRPAICYGLRGLAYVEVIYKGPDKDLHSGTFGGAVTNELTKRRSSPPPALQTPLERTDTPLQNVIGRARPLTSMESFPVTPEKAARRFCPPSPAPR